MKTMDGGGEESRGVIEYEYKMSQDKKNVTYTKYFKCIG